MLKRIIEFFINNRLITIIMLVMLVLWGISHAPFNWQTSFLPRDPVPVDAIPDIGDNQQIIATEWMGRSPRDIEDQISYPLTTSLLGIPGVKTIRSTSMFGMSFIYLIFNDDIDFYWSRTRILEKLNSLPQGTLPQGVQPTLGPDATALGQIYWYTLEGRDPKTGKPNGGWDPQELRTIQDFYVKYALTSAEGVAEVASIGGFVKEYQIDINPEAMKASGVTVMDIMSAVKNNNLDIGAETIELNKVEYIVRGLGYITNLKDIEDAVVAVKNNVPIRIKDVAVVGFGPATRRGGLDVAGAEAAGAVVVARYGSNPMEVIKNVKAKIEEIAAGLPTKKLPDGTESKVTVVPFYDRTGLIQETIGTLEAALTHEIIISILVVIVLVMNLRASFLISSLLPVAVLITFIVMRYFNVQANIVALSGIAIAIGVMIDVGIVYVENIVRHLEMPEHQGSKGKALTSLIVNATTEVSSALTTALATTVVSFLPVFFMEAAEGKLFKPLAFTKSFALLAAFFLGLVVLPTLAHIVFSIRFDKKKIKIVWNSLLIISGLAFMIFWKLWIPIVLVAFGVNNLLSYKWSEKYKNFSEHINIAIAVVTAVYFLTIEWLPLGANNTVFVNFLFVCLLVGVILGSLMLVVKYYEPILRWGLKNKWKFMTIPFITILLGITIWLGFNKTLGFAATGFEKIGLNIRETGFWKTSSEIFPGLGNEFMPALDEGSYLLMPTSMPHTGIEQNQELIEILDKRITAIPEIDISVGKWGRVNSALDPAPVQMFENTINYKSEYILDEDGRKMRFKVDEDENFILKDSTTYNPNNGFRKISKDELIPDNKGEYFRQWRPEIKNADDIWNEIINVTNLPGLTSAPKLQPIQTRLVMLSTGMRAPMGLKVFGPSLDTIEKAGVILEKILKEIPSVKPSTVFYDRAVGAPYIELKLDREAMSRFGMNISEVQEIIQVAIGGMAITNTVEGRERFPVRVRYARELRNTPEEIKNILIPTMTGGQIPLDQIATIQYKRGPQMIRSEDTFLNGYVIFDKIDGKAEVDVVEEAQKFLADKIASGELVLQAGVSYKFAGNYEQQTRAAKRLLILVPLSLLLVLLLLYMQFRTFIASFIHFSGVFVAFAGGFIMIWLYGQDWFMNFSFAGVDMRELFQIHTINMSVAVWVGFIALFGIATDDGVIMGTYIHQVFEKLKPATIHDVREAVVIAGKKRVRPAMMTAAVAIIALLPVLSSTGKGSDIMVPMAIPTFGGMIIQLMTMFVVPILQCVWRESEIRINSKKMQKLSAGKEEV